MRPLGAGATTGCSAKGQALPKDLVLGMGCCRGTEAQTLAELAVRVLAEHHLSIQAVCKVASIDLKADEPGILAFCHFYSLPFQVFTAQELLQAQGVFTASDFVRRITGVDNVCERAAVLGSGGPLIVPKTSEKGVTIAVARRPIVSVR